MLPNPRPWTTRRADPRPRRHVLRLALPSFAGLMLVFLAAAGDLPGAAGPTEEPPLPVSLAGTGLYADAAALLVDPAHLSFAPQYPLWTDGAEKRRWISLPPGSAISARDSEAWEFPIGTRIWKEFRFDGRPVETRFMRLGAGGTWQFGSYAWDADGREALLVGEKGKRNAYPLEDGAWHRIPGQADCRACHLSGPSPVLGIGVLQSSALRDPGALHVGSDERLGATLPRLVAAGLLKDLDPALAAQPRRIAGTALARAAQGYLHGNCGHCHNRFGPLRALGLDLRQPAAHAPGQAVATSWNVTLHKPPPGLRPGTSLRIAAGAAGLSAIPQRMASRDPLLTMPPLGTTRPDRAAVDLITRWIDGGRMVPPPPRHLEPDPTCDSC